MEPNKIKAECEAMYAQIKQGNERLKELRTMCKHENTFEGNWSWRAGSIMPAVICSDCGNLIGYIKNVLPTTQYSTKQTEQFAVYEKEPAHGKDKNGVIFGPCNTKDEAEEAKIKYGYDSDNYYVDIIK